MGAVQVGDMAFLMEIDEGLEGKVETRVIKPPVRRLDMECERALVTILKTGESEGMLPSKEKVGDKVKNPINEECTC